MACSRRREEALKSSRQSRPQKMRLAKEVGPTRFMSAPPNVGGYIAKHEFQNLMDISLWVKMHGGTTHFPIALVMASALFDLAGLIVPENLDKSRRAGLRAAGFYSIVLGAIGSIGAVVSGLVISHGQLWGRGNLARHHLFLWPAFGLLTGLAVWRVVVGSHASTRSLKLYMGVALTTAALMGAAGYWGGELLLKG
jgi:uncharacterized membrane protein